MQAAGWTFPVPVSVFKIHIMTEFFLLPFYFWHMNDDLPFPWHCNEHKTRGDLNLRHTRVCKRFEVGKNEEEMSKAKGPDRFLHGVNAWFKPF